MINLFNAQIETLSLHKIGNKSRNESMVLSDSPYKLNDEITPLLKEFFLKPFREKEENYFQFAHEVDLEYNTLFSLINDCFHYKGNPEALHLVSKRITEHLFEQSNHPHIKNGEVYVVYFTNVSIDNIITDAVGIFKSEIKKDFIQIQENGSHLEMLLEQGILLEKIDKGALIFNHKKEDGYKVLTIDSNRYDARYWLEHFLSVDAFHDENFNTKKYLKFCQDFAREVVLPAEDKKEEVMFMNKAVNHFAKNDQFEESNFFNEVIDNPDLIAEFKNFKVDKGAKYSIEDLSTFPISNSAVSDARRKIKSVINLDTNVQIRINITNPEVAEKVIEKGYDEEKGMYYYLVYFHKETK
ncbi:MULTISPECIES: nucleoid-associated protein [Flavobacterium]|uniref:Nucleoid-associated protein n=1 Tax=Flavobacterium keumense TaxID=1306518 RepID=A0ABY8N367_9FLAO|nr:MULTISPECIES: nucleoid-associated protein [Flavobacterium]WGK93771.1 nucleoid-associated protein [Flavobacterium keumense]